MSKKNSNSFDDFFYDDENLSPAERAEIEFKAELIGKLIEARDAKGGTQEQSAKTALAYLWKLKTMPQIDTLIKILMPLGYKLAIVPKGE